MYTMTTSNNQSPASTHLSAFPSSTSSKSQVVVRPAFEWKVSNTIEIDDADIMFDGQPLSTLYENTRHSFEYQIRDDIKGSSQRGRKSRRD